MSEPRKLDLEAEVARLAAIAKRPRPVQEKSYGDDGYAQELEDNRSRHVWDQWIRVIPSRFRDAKAGDFASEPEDTRQLLRDWTENHEGRNLLLLGPVGTGKTHAAVAAARVLYFGKKEVVAFWPVVELLDGLRPEGREGALQEAMTAPVLILDDLGAEKPTEWTAERLYAVVNRRWLEQRPTIATSNLPATRKTAPKDHEGPTLDEALGPRMFSRLVGSGAVIVRLSGPDRRR